MATKSKKKALQAAKKLKQLERQYDRLHKRLMKLVFAIAKEERKLCPPQDFNESSRFW